MRCIPFYTKGSPEQEVTPGRTGSGMAGSSAANHATPRHAQMVPSITAELAPACRRATLQVLIWRRPETPSKIGATKSGSRLDFFLASLRAILIASVSTHNFQPSFDAVDPCLDLVDIGLLADDCFDVVSAVAAARGCAGFQARQAGADLAQPAFQTVLPGA